MKATRIKELWYKFLCFRKKANKACEGFIDTGFLALGILFMYITIIHRSELSFPLIITSFTIALTFLHIGRGY